MPVNPQLSETYDLIIVGSGGGSMAAALVAKKLGKRAVILEKQDVIGGSTGFSGGVWWIPNNSLLREAGIADSFEKSKTYFDNAVTYQGPGVTPQRRDAFLRAGPKMLDFLRGLGLKVRRPLIDWPDYYDDVPGGLPAGRSVMPVSFNLNELGDWKPHLSINKAMSAMKLGSDEFPALLMVKRTLAGKLKAIKLVSNMLKDKITGRETVYSGGAIQGQMLKISLREAVEIHRNTPFERFLFEDGKVTGVVVQRDGKPREVRAPNVIVNAGGFAHDGKWRQQVTDGPITGDWTNANPGDTGEVLKAMIDLGAMTDCLDTAWWLVTSRNLNGTWPEGVVMPDGKVNPFMHHMDLSMPYLIMVDQNGKRFADESGAYMEIGERLYARHRESGGRGIPAWVIFDKRNRDRYVWGNAPPGRMPKSWLESGYMKKADSLDELAAICGIDAAGLKAEVERFNGFCRTGVDEDYNRGGRVFDRAHGDPTVKPNPNLGPIEQGPFYACAIFHGDVGTAGGVVADEYARVLDQSGKPIPGLYAVGNCTASVFGRCYPGAGASIGASFTFGYVGALHALGSNELESIISD
jgi:3-oxosteroid 1-dehydrogenase